MFPAEIGRRLTEVSAFHPMPGGAPANVAVAARRLGASSAFIGQVGDDAFGHHLIATLQAEGVETRGMRLDGEARTSMAFIALPDAQAAEFIFYRNPGADMRLRAGELDEALLRGARVFHFGSISLGAEPSRGATLRALDVARAAGALITFDVNYRPSLWPNPEAAVAAVRAVLSLVDVVKVNGPELALLTGGQDAATGGAALRAMGAKLVVITRGAAGSYYYDATSGHDAATGFAPPFDVEVVDATGCGDAFMAALLTRLIAPRDGPPDGAFMAAALRYANAAGALTATRHGAMAALPTATEVDAFLEEERESTDFTDDTD